MSTPRSISSSSKQPLRASLSLTSDRISKVYKILMLGDAGCGKTSLIKQYAYNIFEENSTAPTIGVDFVAKQVAWNEFMNVNLQVWDIPGSQRSSVVTSTFYNYAMGALLVYDATVPGALNSVLAWREDVNSRICLPNGELIPYVLVANKCDLDEARVDPEVMEQFVRDENFVGWYGTSAKTGLNIDEAVRRLVAKILDIEEVFSEEQEKHIRVSTSSQPQSSKKCC